MERITEITNAWDRRDSDPKKNYGIHGCNLRMILRGDKGAYQFVIFTNWHLPHVIREIGSRAYEPSRGDRHWMERPMPADVGYHSLTPQYDDQPSMGPCEYLDGQACYYDGSGLQAEEMFDKLVAEGSEAVWAELERLYVQRFGEDESGNKQP